jgi:uncharacterized membrane protein (UPF0127 family)
MMAHLPLLIAAACALLAGCQAQPGGAAPAAAERAVGVPLTIQTAGGVRRFMVEVARTEQEQAQGLMYRTALPQDGGMIFPMEPPRPATFWMKNTPLPLDMIFIRADGTIARIAAETVPYSLDMVESGEPVAAVLEIAGGAAAAAGIEEGNRVSWPKAPSR